MVCVMRFLAVLLLVLNASSLHAATSVEVWLTSEDLRRRLSPQSSLAFDAGVVSATNRGKYCQVPRGVFPAPIDPNAQGAARYLLRNVHGMTFEKWQALC